MQRPPTRIFELGCRAYAQFSEDNLWYLCCVKSYNAQLDTYVVEFETTKNVQTCHASQLYPMMVQTSNMSLTNNQSFIVSSAEGAEGTLSRSVDLEKRESSGDSSFATSKERLSNSDGGKGERLAKLSSIDRQKDTHSRQLKKISSYDTEKMSMFKREEKLNAMSKFSLPSQKTSRLLMVHQMGPSRVARFPGTERDSHNSSSDQDSESSSSAAPLPQGLTLDELMASGKTVDEEPTEKRRSRMLFRRPTEEAIDQPQNANSNSNSNANSNLNVSDSAEGSALESLLLTQVPVSKTRSLKVKAVRKVASVNSVFEKESAVSSSSEESAEMQKTMELKELLGNFNPRSMIKDRKELKEKKGSESLLNLVRLSRQHHTSIQQEKRVDVSAANSCVELIAGNRCEKSLESSDGSDSISWKIFVEQLHFTTPSISRVIFGPLPPHGAIEERVCAPFEVSSVLPLLFVQSMDFQIKIAVFFVGSDVPVLIYHDLNFPGSWAHFEAETATGSLRQISNQISEPFADSAVRQPDLNSPEAIETQIRSAFAKENLVAAEEVARLADRIGKEFLVQPLKKKRTALYCVNALRCRIRAFLSRAAKLKGAKNVVEKIGDSDAGVSDTVQLAAVAVGLAADAIEGSQFVGAVCAALCGPLHPLKALILAAKTISACLDRWSASLRVSPNSVPRFVATTEEFRKNMEETVLHPPNVSDEEEVRSRTEAALRKLRESSEKRKSLLSSKTKSTVFEKVMAVEEAPMSPSLSIAAIAPNSPNSPPSASNLLEDMPGNPLMMSGGQLNVELVEDVSESSSGNNSTENSPKSLLCPTFAAVDYLEVSRARSEELLMRSNFVLMLRDALSEHSSRNATVFELLLVISSPSRSALVQALPPFRKNVQRVRCLFKMVHASASLLKQQIRQIAQSLSLQPRSAVASFAALFESLLPLLKPLEGDQQLQIMHETIRLGHFCDLMELFRMFCREPLLSFLASTSPVQIGTVAALPISLILDRLSHDGVHNLFLSLLGAELVLPRTVSFSDKIDLVPILISKLVIISDADVATAENASNVLKKIISSLDHTHLNVQLTLRHKELFVKTFVADEVQLRISIRVLSDWSLMTLGKFRPVEEKVFNECVNTVVSYLPAVKDILLNSSRTRVGFLRMEMIDFIAGLINARCAKVDEALLSLDVLSAVVDLLFDFPNASLLHSHITEFVLVPICEDPTSKLMQGLVVKAKLVQRLMEHYVNLAESDVGPSQVNGFLTIIAVAIAKSGAAESFPGWNDFVLSRLLPVVKLQQRGVSLASDSDSEQKPKHLIVE